MSARLKTPPDCFVYRHALGGKDNSIKVEMKEGRNGKKKKRRRQQVVDVCMYVRMYVCLFGALELAGRPPRAWHCILRAGGKLKSSRVESSRVESFTSSS